MNGGIKSNSTKYLQKRMIQMFGSVKLDPWEEIFLELGPNFAMMEDMNLDRINTDLLISLTKIRLGRRGKEESEVVRYREMEDIIDEEKKDMISNLDRREVNFENKTVRPGHKRCTNMKGNRRIMFPGGRPAKEKEVMEVRLEMWMGIVKKYCTEETKESVQNSDLLTKEQMMGRNSVQLN